MWFYRYKGTAIEGRGGVRADQPSWSTHASLHSQAPSHKTEGLESQEEGELGMARDDNGFISECRKGLKMGLQLPCPLAQHYWAHQHSSHTVLRLGYPKNPTATHPDTFHSPRWNSPQGMKSATLKNILETLEAFRSFCAACLQWIAIFPSENLSLLSYLTCTIGTFREAPHTDKTNNF